MRPRDSSTAEMAHGILSSLKDENGQWVVASTDQAKAFTVSSGYLLANSTVSDALHEIDELFATFSEQMQSKTFVVILNVRLD